jgi:transcriptional regulator GlxA family with amidase domain
MKVAFVLYDGFNMFELAGILEPMERLRQGGYLESLSWSFCARREEVTDKGGLVVRSLERPDSLSGFDVVVVPGGPGVGRLLADRDFLDWFRTAKSAHSKVAVSSGALLLGAAGFLEGRLATTHPEAAEDLARYCRGVSDERIVEDRDCLTSRGAGAATDLGLHLCRRWAGDEADLAIRYAMDYRG